jgi:asparagine synthase (glutamine-hydrolysing)
VCGIAGILNLADDPPPAIDELSRMIGAIRHRGPDALGVYRDAHVGLAHARLSIIDRRGGAQPLSDAAGEIWVSYNGEIYNHVELRAELESRGHAFRTRSDTEVLVAAYQAFGDACVERFEGQFAFALWDAPKRRLLLARDRFGVRPLHVARIGRRLAFASEIKALFQLEGVERALDPEGLAQVFTLWTPVAPRTAFAGISEIRPGHLAVITPGGELRERAWFDPTFPARDRRAEPERPARIEESEAALTDALARSVSLRLLRADVPVGCYLSGGLDSAVVAALARRVHAGALRTFSIRFEDPSLDEGPFQRAMVERLATQHDEVFVARGDVARAFPEVMAHVERPILRAGPAPLFLLSRAVRDAGIKVVLTGEGADEVLAGYDIFREAKVRAFVARQPGSTRRPLLFDRLYPWLARGPREARDMARRFFTRDADPEAPLFSHLPRFRAAAALMRLFSPALRSSLAGSDVMGDLTASLPAAFASFGPLARAQYLEMRTLLSGYLLAAQGDRASLAHAVEGRFPFLDSGVVAAAARMPASHKLHVLDEKHVLKRLAARLVPRAILERPKQPYRAPDAASFFGPGAPDYVAALLGEASLRESGLFDPALVARLVAKCRDGLQGGAPLGNADNMAFVGVLSTQLVWHELCRTPPPCPPPGEARIIDRSRAE